MYVWKIGVRAALPFWSSGLRRGSVFQGEAVDGYIVQNIHRSSWAVDGGTGEPRIGAPAAFAGWIFIRFPGVMIIMMAIMKYDSDSFTIVTRAWFLVNLWREHQRAVICDCLLMLLPATTLAPHFVYSRGREGPFPGGRCSSWMGFSSRTVPQFQRSSASRLGCHVFFVAGEISREGEFAYYSIPALFGLCLHAACKAESQGSQPS